MRATRNARLVTLLGATTVCLPATALALPVRTPVGVTDSSCVHELPPGGQIDVQTGDVTVAGLKVDHFDRCGVQPISAVGSQNDASPEMASVHPPCPTTTGGWYEYTWANASTIGGLTQFNYMSVNWLVPHDPGGGLVYLFPSMETTDGAAILQPVLSWGDNGFFGGSYWSFAAWGVWDCSNCACSQYYTTPYTVSVGDELNGTIEQIAGNPDAWNVYAYDVTTNYYTVFQVVNVPSTWSKFSTAQTGVLEAYSIGCSQLPSDEYAGFALEGLDQSGPSWNSYNDVTSSMRFTAYSNPSNLSPNCTWDPYVSGQDTYLTWTN